MKSTERKFRMRAPCVGLENIEVIPGQSVDTWSEALEWLSYVTPDRVHSFRIQINYKRHKPEVPAAPDKKTK